MGVGKRFRQVAQLIGSLVMLAGLAGVGAVAYFWWDSRQPTKGGEFDTATEASDVGAEETAADEVEETAE